MGSKVPLDWRTNGGEGAGWSEEAVAAVAISRGQRSEGGRNELAFTGWSRFYSASVRGMCAVRLNPTVEASLDCSMGLFVAQAQNKGGLLDYRVLDSLFRQGPFPLSLILHKKS